MSKKEAPFLDLLSEWRRAETYSKLPSNAKLQICPGKALEDHQDPSANPQKKSFRRTGDAQRDREFERTVNKRELGQWHLDREQLWLDN